MALSTVSLGFASGLKLFIDTVNANAAVSVVGAAAVIYEIEIDNTANAAQDNYVKFYNTAGAVVVGTTVPDMVIEVRQGVKRQLLINEGLSYETGIAVATVTAGGTAGTSAPGSAVIVRVAYTS